MKIGLLAFLSFTVLLPNGVQGQGEKPDVIGGTLIMALGNSHGLVVLTDSMQTYGKSSESEPGQKLVQLDETTVCAIAGAAKIPVEGLPQFFTQVSAIITEFGTQLTEKHGKVSMLSKARGLSALVQQDYSVLADVRETTNADKPNYHPRYTVNIILAGYDLDGAQKVETIDLLGFPEPVSANGKRWYFKEAIEEIKVGSALEWRLRGVSDLANDILKYPNKYREVPAIKRFAESMALDKGDSLTISEIVELGKVLEQKTADIDARVGGENQYAVFSAGNLTINQRYFQKPPSPIKFTVIEDSTLDGEGLIYFSPGPLTVWINSTLVHQRHLNLERNIFIDSVIQDSFVFYDGGFYFLSKDTRVRNTVLLFGLNVSRESPRTMDLVSKFPWVKDNGLAPFP